MPAAALSHRATAHAVVRALSILCLGVPARALLAQHSLGPDGGPALATRAYLQTALARLEQTHGSGAEMAMISNRLANGDFRPGDRIVIDVEGERTLSDTFTVGPGPALVLPQIGDVPLAGVLRAELQERVVTAIARYVRSPVVRAQSFIRILVEGEVSKPGFYPIPPDLPLVDVVTVAGGLTQRAKTRGMRVQRGPKDIWSGRTLERALARGVTLDQLSLQAGDRLFVPTRGGQNPVFWALGTIATLSGVIFTLTQIF